MPGPTSESRTWLCVCSGQQTRCVPLHVAYVKMCGCESAGVDSVFMGVCAALCTIMPYVGVTCMCVRISVPVHVICV